MAREADLELWDIDIDQSSVPGHPEAWTLAGYTWDPVGLVATRKSVTVENRGVYASSIQQLNNNIDINNSNSNPSGDNDSGGGSNQDLEPGMEVDPRDGGLCPLDPELLSSAPVYQPQPAGSKMMICQVAGCGVNLEGMKGYFLRHRVCEEHSKAPVLLIGDIPSRLCQQCSKFHHVSAFEGSKRTCRVQLDRIRINKRIRRNRKLNAAASTALAAAAGFQDEGDGGTLGELPARPASAFGGGGGRAKRPADSSGSGEGSWIYSRKSSRHGGTGGGAVRGARGGAACDVVGSGAGDALAASAATAAATIAGIAATATFNEPEPLPESGASDTGSREHPRASLGLSGLMRWPGTLSSAPPPPRSPPSAVVAGVASEAMGHVVAGGFGEGGSGSGAALAHSPASAVTGGSGSAGAGVDNSTGMQNSGFSNNHFQQPQQQQNHPHQSGNRVTRLDSLPVSGADVGGPGSIAAAAAAAGLVNEGSLTAPLGDHAVPSGLDLASLVRQQDSAAAAAQVLPGQHLAAGSPVDGTAACVGVPQAAGQAVRLNDRIAAAAGCLLRPLSGPDSGGSSSAAAQEITSLWSTTAALLNRTEGAAAAVAAAAAVGTVERQLSQQRQPSLPESGSGGGSGPEMLLSATSLHPLLQQQLQQELLLHQQKLQLQQQSMLQQPLLLEGSRPLLQGESISIVNLTELAAQQQQQQQLNQASTRLCHQQLQQQQALLIQQHQAASTGTLGQILLDVPMQLPGCGDASLLATTTAAAGGAGTARLAESQFVAAAVQLPLPAQAAAISQLSGPSNVTGCSAPGARKAPGSASHTGGGGDTDGGGRAAGTSIPSGGTNALSSSKLVRMSLENDDALDESGMLLSNLMDLLQTQAAEPRDSATAEPRIAWTANNTGLTFSEPDSCGRGNGSMEMSAAGTAAAAAASNGFGGLAGAGGGGGRPVALGDLSNAAALSRASSGAVGSPQEAAMLKAAAAGVASRLGSLEALGVGVPGAALAGCRGGTGLLAAAAAAAGLGTTTGALTVPVPGALAAAAAASAAAGGGGGGVGGVPVLNGRMLDGLGSLSAAPGLSAQLQEQALRAPTNPLATTNDLLLQQQLLLAQQQQQLQLLQQQQLLRLQQAQAHAQAQVPGVIMSGGAAAAAPSVPAAGLLLSRLLDADTKTHHLSTELNGCLVEKQLLRRQLLATLSTCQGTDVEQLTVAGTSAANVGSPAAAAVASVGAISVPGAAQLALQRPLLGGLANAAAAAGGLGAGLGLGGGAGAGLASSGLGGFPGLGPAGLVDTTGGGVMGLGATGLRPGVLAAAGLDMHALHMGAGGGVVGGGAASLGNLATGGAQGPLGLGSAGSGLLGAGRPSAALQLQALAETRAAAVAAAAAGASTVVPPQGVTGAFGAGGPVVLPGAGGAAGGAAAAAGSSSGGTAAASAAAGYSGPDLLTRVSLKIMNCLPDELPSDIRGRMQAFASQAPLDLVQGCLRPGCTEVVLDALHCGDEARMVSELLRNGNADAAAAALLAALPPALHSKEIYLQAADKALCLRPGAPPRHTSWAGMGIRRGGLRVSKPVLAGAETLVVHLNGADMEPCVRVRVYGKHLADPGVTFLARLAGLALEVNIKPVGGDVPVAAAAAGSVTATTTTTSQSRDNATSLTCAPQPRKAAANAAAPAIATTAAVGSAISMFAAPTTPSPSPSPPLPAATAASDAASDGDAAGRCCSMGLLYDAFDVEVRFPYYAPPQGLLILETRAGVLLGDWAAVLLLEDAATAAEVEGVLRDMEPDQARRLAASLGMFVDHAERCATVLEARERERNEQARRRDTQERHYHADMEGEEEEPQQEEDYHCHYHHYEDDGDVEVDEDGEEMEDGAASRADVQSVAAGFGSVCVCAEVFGAAHGRVVRMGHTLLAYSALRGSARLMSYLGSQLVEMGEPLSALPTASYKGIDLLACAVLSGCGPVISIAAAWAARSGTAVSWRAQVPGQPAGVNLLHLAASLPLSLAVHTLDTLWALATSAKQTPAAAGGEAFASAWFADAGAETAFDAPSLLFRVAISSAVSAAAAAAYGTAAAVPPSACSAAAVLTSVLAADNLDRLCLMRLASSYIRMHNYTSPLDNVDLPSLEANSCAGLSGVVNPAPSLRQLDAGGDAGADAVQDLDLGAAASAAALRSSPIRLACRTADNTLLAAPPSRADNADRSGHGSVGGPPTSGSYEPLAALIASCGQAAAGLQGAAATGDALAAGGPPQSPPAAVAASPPRIRVSVAPKALAQTAAAAAAAVASSRQHGTLGSSSWLDGGGSGADASCAPPSGTTNATTTLFASGSLPAFASGMTAAGMGPYASSMASYFSQVAAAAAAGKPTLPLEPLVDMFRPLPESPSSGQDNNSGTAGGGGGAAAASGPLPPACGSQAGGNDATATTAIAMAIATDTAAAFGMLGDVRGSGFGVTAVPRSSSAAAPGHLEALFREQEEEEEESGDPQQLPSEVSAAAAAAAEPGSERLRGHMRGLARMFKRLFKKGSGSEGVGAPE